MRFKLNPRGGFVARFFKRVGAVRTINSQSVRITALDNAGDVAECEGAFAITDGGAGYSKGCIHRRTNGGAGTTLYINEGTNASCDFNPLTNIATPSDGSVTPAKLAASEALTATADGTGTGAMSGATSHAVVTSAAAGNQVSLPASSAALIGKVFTLWVGANGFELITPAGSNATINNVDSDGTNQADIPANTLSRLTLVAANTWILENLTNLGAVTTAIIPDND
jgi:hypothetical protein